MLWWNKFKYKIGLVVVLECDGKLMVISVNGFHFLCHRCSVNETFKVF
jgi:hypothetical protein